MKEAQSAEDRVLLNFYDAASDASLWERALGEAAAHLGGFGAQFLIWDDALAEVRFSRHFGFDDRILGLYAAHYGQVDPRRRRLEGQPLGTLLLCQDTFDEAFVSRSEFYQDFLLPNGARYLMGAKVTAGEGTSGYLAFHRDVGQGPFPAEAVASFRRLVPHAVRAARMGARLLDLQATAERLEGVLQGMPWGVAVVDESGQVGFANAKAERLLGDATGVSIAHGRLKAGDAPDPSALAAAIRNAARPQGAARFAEALSLQRGNGSALSVAVSPLTERTAAGYGVGRPAALVLVTDPGASPQTSVDMLRRAFRLTAAEADVAQSLAEGRSVQEIAEGQGKSPNTVRAQLKSVLSKTGASRQAELVRRVMNLPQLAPDRPA